MRARGELEMSSGVKVVGVDKDEGKEVIKFDEGTAEGLKGD